MVVAIADDREFANDSSRSLLSTGLTVDERAILVWGGFNDGMSGEGPTLTPLPDFATASELGPTSVPDSVAFVVAKVERGVEEIGRG